MRVKLIEGKNQGLDIVNTYLVNTLWPNGSVSIIKYGRANNTKRYTFRDDEYTICECGHTITRHDHCMECGKLIFATETRPCSECQCFHECLLQNRRWYLL
jgi:hypothetical protein